MAMTANSFPEYWVIIGKVVSIVVAPPLHIGAYFPNNFTKSGAPTRARSSLMMLASRAIAPNCAAICAPTSGVLICMIKIDDSE